MHSGDFGFGVSRGSVGGGGSSSEISFLQVLQILRTYIVIL